MTRRNCRQLPSVVDGVSRHGLTTARLAITDAPKKALSYFNGGETKFEGSKAFANEISRFEKLFPVGLPECFPPSVIKSQLLARKHRDCDARLVVFDVAANGGHRTPSFDDSTALRLAIGNGLVELLAYQFKTIGNLGGQPRRLLHYVYAPTGSAADCSAKPCPTIFSKRFVR